MSESNAKAQLDKEIGDPPVGYVSPADIQDAIGIIYDDFEAADALLPGGTGHNILQNGAMQVSQRGTSFAGTSGIVYTTDRWFTYRAAGATGHTVTQVASGLARIQYCSRVQRNSSNAATDAVFLEQDLETRDSIPYQGETVTLSFWARAGANFSSASSALGVLVQSGTGTDQRIQSGFTGAASVVSTTVTLTTTWQRFTATGTVPANSTQLGVRFGFTPVGTASTNDYFEVTGVQLETGSTVHGFEYRDYAQELAECQRYFYMHAEGTDVIGVASYYSTVSVYSAVPFPVTMRVTPTLYSSSGTGYFTVERNSGTNTLNSLTLDANPSSPRAGYLYNSTQASGTAGMVGILYSSNASAYLGFTAEL